MVGARGAAAGERVTQIQLCVAEVRVETAHIHRIALVAADGGALPRFESGAHLRFVVPGLHQPRCYSLVQTCAAEVQASAPQQYWVAVRREDPSLGGSLWMHGLKSGDTVFAEPPRNDFPLHSAHANELPVVLLAGGIGITPIASHAAALRLAGRPFALHYSGRSRDQLALVPELQALCGEMLHLYADDDPVTRLDLGVLLDACQPAQHLYVCGPKGLIDTVLAQASARGWPREHVHFELFTQAAPVTGDVAFEVELRQTGMTLRVPADQTILDVMEQAGCDPMFDCRRGECGVCQAGVLEGVPDHRDYFLSDREKAAGNLIQICISRAKTARLVLDL